MIDLCVFCDRPTGDSDEHILLNALGGRKRSKRLICAVHNNLFGGGIDRGLSDGLRPLASLLAIRPQRGTPPSINLEPADGSGDRVTLRPGGHTLGNTGVEIEPIDDKRRRVTVSVDASQLEQGRKILEGIVAKYGGKLEPETLEVHEEITPSGPLDFQLELNSEGLRCVAKMALLLLASEVGTGPVKVPAFAAIRSAILDGPGLSELVRHDYETDFPSAGDLAGPFVHQVIASASPETGCAIGLVELYGTFRFGAILAEEWTGEPVAVAYRVDPITGRHETTRGFAPPATAAADLRQVASDRAGLNRAVGELFGRLDARVRELGNGRVADRAIADAFAGLAEGDTITEEHIATLSARVAELFVAFHWRVPHRRALDSSIVLSPLKRHRES